MKPANKRLLKICSNQKNKNKVKTFKQLLDENKSRSAPQQPPNVLIMKRKSVRNFNNGQRVALYYIEKLDKYVTIPYGADDNDIIVPTDK